MLITRRIAEGIRDGSVTTQYRRWDEPRVKVGGTQMTSAGIIRFTRVTRVSDLDRITDRAAQAAGMKNADTLRKALTSDRPRSPRGGRGGDTVFRINVEWVGEDPRIALREMLPDGAELADLHARLTRMESRRDVPWIRDILTWIRDNPRVVSTVLAERRGVELQPMKADIRKLKALGLTISHDVGYELSPRGAAYLSWLDRRLPPDDQD
ncbi:hypothetical protein [Jongsikchunia kroppenstedtii]|uniref:hypothetical protein n=1 Tax=Jongsikchunia kroppenstedtii TaxID=1121721 RepID=UPI00036B2EB5|nr:hypothetical protein [Jongsikchunia kroppenstedtii]